MRVLLVTLAVLACGLLGFGLALLSGPYPNDPNTTSAGYALLFAAGGLVVLAAATLRGSRVGWLLTCLVTGFFAVLPLALWIADVVDDLGRPEPTGTVVLVKPASWSVVESVSDLSGCLVVGGAAGATVVLLLPATRRELRRRRDVRRTGTPPADAGNPPA